MKKSLLALALVSVAGVAMAQSHDAYVSASYGLVKMSDTSSATQLLGVTDINRTGHIGRLAAGWQFKKNLAVELGYADLGSYSIDGGVGDLKAQSYDVSLVGRYELTPSWSATGRLGYATTDGKYNGSTKSYDTPVYGVGVEHQIDKQWAINATWDRYHNFADLGIKVDSVSAGLKYRF